MSNDGRAHLIERIDPALPVLIAGPTASGKSALAVEIAQRQGGVIVNADASQVYACWRVITARPSEQEEAQAPHLLYGHVGAHDTYSTGHWLREVETILSAGTRPIIVGGTGLYFKALTEGLAEIPAIPDAIRTEADRLPHQTMLDALDPFTRERIDNSNPARVQRAWEVLHATGTGMATWQERTPGPLLPSNAATRIALSVERDWLNARIERRFDAMIAGGALEEIATVAPEYDPQLPAHRAIGVPELMQYHRGDITLDEAREAAVIATRQYAKRQRTWQRSKMADWLSLSLPD